MDMTISQVRGIVKCMSVLYEYKPHQYNLAPHFAYFAMDPFMEQTMVLFAQRESGKRRDKLIMAIEEYRYFNLYSGHFHTPSKHIIKGR